MSRQPLSVAEILEKQKQESALKPRFLSKAERAANAEHEKQEQERQRAQKQELERKQRLKFEQQARSVASSSSSSSQRHPARPSARGSDRYRSESEDLDYGSVVNGRADDRRRRPDTDIRNGNHHFSNGQPHVSNGYAANGGEGAEASSSSSSAPLTESEQASIRRRYLGLKEDKKKPKRRPTDKKFVFEWGEEDDTATESLTVQIQAETNASAATSYSSRYDSLDKRFDDKHWSEKSLSQMKDRDWRIFREDFGISARGGNIPKPLRSWRESGIPASILSTIEEVGYKEPSPIQRQAIPIGLQNRDLIGIAETGSGKTASFLIPLLAYISKLPKLDEHTKALGPQALILVPTRELAQQIETETNKFAGRLGLRCVSIVGGRDMNDQAYALRDGAEIVIATPGRLKDCIERHVLVLSQCTYVVMDEADKMVDMGFEPQVNFILDSLPVSNLKPDNAIPEGSADDMVGKYRVTMLYSATMPPSVERMARVYLRRPATITIGDAGQAVATVEQIVEFIPTEDQRRTRLISILQQSSHLVPIIVFVNQKKAADQLSSYLTRHGFHTSTLHSGKTQDLREEALANLRSGHTQILVATDLAGRGIDVPDVGLVVNFAMPNNIEAYIHRIGRTGRAGKQGTAVTFVDQADSDLFWDLKQELTKSKLSTVPQQLARHPAAMHKPVKDGMGKRKREREDDG
ncbi:putative U5 snRNP protein [Mycosarcoma maydis]|uniref:RNA helicase n=1 Tax=Mycosarcoma maydis TaxID=5270 RepID=A0A0D1C3B6_MYCMD|nr:putative U5 snRNP protein [Ustilago maydis 521]KIS68202.1 putative U5 snRNP protein [Ustilago maydis 521]|eukprot:XP_011390339.1 putative U5 snRNP protein [Ustilago maydis 521]